MKRKIIITDDGSSTIQIPEWNEQYHSTHGAIQEAQHVFIKNGLHYFVSENKTKTIAILEIGFGTGLNAFITLLESEKLKLNINYHGVEAYPVALEELKQLNYVSQLQAFKKEEAFHKMHVTPWGATHSITESFQLHKEQKDFLEITHQEAFDVIYFDAFGARVQPELWTEFVFEIMYKALKPNGVLVTYAARGSVKRALKSIGFTLERLAGPPGKRHMLRAVKNV
ncbi:tRNA U34 5-methylaminomethyl-2-thiouridine-forming methyltransferase MnmC [Oceanihabitans sediminis]|uniref:SAM-dependent methyltransferase n=1 Tax=Oceanihabitans sediminis TaxID=1812012 RepID=A0A368P4Z5_9FLAO|nr:tRNA (5-methylaminomethyl-2-thiouridine)(34)-methyltransferase MnmD [Oceanihabitans sediminis]MDX1774062.1 tRNA (5-methylaminomethyl-2-thiouridine)(34)-methyltransferase MnmD [Oceanihabitans sediminis]RBP30897.1 tRNA U34 5-methylaminomethyl-2-thiouridine-forming methyltransferase MnmC [Oceanihabitans sediminis]RCU56859.1 SAM-dependent methyltransferase [Oceanihabitans sediminis]